MIPFRDSFTMKLCVWTLTNDTSYNETSLTKRRFGHRFELKLNKESRLITEMLCVDRESVTSVTNWAGLNVTSSERRPDCRVSGLLSSVYGHP